MERLTQRLRTGEVLMASNYEEKYTEQGWIDVLQNRLAAYEDTWLTPEEIDMDHEAAEQLRHLCQNCDLDQLEELAEADKEGRVVMLPCKVGDTVWAILDSTKYAMECKVDFVNIGRFNTTIVLYKADGLREQYGVTVAAFGKTVFLTREEAEEALRRAENG